MARWRPRAPRWTVSMRAGPSWRPSKPDSGAPALPHGHGLPHGGQESVAEGLYLPVADTFDLAKLLEGRRPRARHVAQGRIGEDEVRQIGRASCRERVWSSGVAVLVEKK